MVSGLLGGKTILRIDDEELADQVLGLLRNAIPVRRMEVVLT